jgi:hypothetical protein
VSRFVPDSRVHLLHPKNRLAVAEGGAHTLADSVRIFASERENVSEKRLMRWSTSSAPFLGRPTAALPVSAAHGLARALARSLSKVEPSFRQGKCALSD